MVKWIEVPFGQSTPCAQCPGGSTSMVGVPAPRISVAAATRLAPHQRMLNTISRITAILKAFMNMGINLAVFIASLRELNGNEWVKFLTCSRQASTQSIGHGSAPPLEVERKLIRVCYFQSACVTSPYQYMKTRTYILAIFKEKVNH